LRGVRSSGFCRSSREEEHNFHGLEKRSRRIYADHGAARERINEDVLRAHSAGTGY
jgi:hypothetical protein